MREDSLFSVNPILYDNISRLIAERGLVDEARLIEIRDLALDAAKFSAGLIDSGHDIVEVLPLFSAELNFGDYSLHDIALPENHRPLSALLRGIKVDDRANFSTLYLGLLRDLGLTVNEEDFLPYRGADISVAYLKNQYSDEAFDVLTVGFKTPKVKYVTSIKDAAQLVADGICGYALMPLEEHGARIRTVAELVYRTDLKINSVTPIFGFDGRADMKYALLSKDFDVPPPALGDDRYIEIRISATRSNSLAEIISAAESLGKTVYRIDTISFDTEGESESFYTLVLRDEGEEFTELLIYLVLFADDAEIVGVYKNLE